MGHNGRLLAHELAYVIQQEAMEQPHLVQRQGMGEVRLAEAIGALIDKIRAAPAYKALDTAGEFASIHC